MKKDICKRCNHHRKYHERNSGGFVTEEYCYYGYSPLTFFRKPCDCMKFIEKSVQKEEVK